MDETFLNVPNGYRHGSGNISQLGTRAKNFLRQKIAAHKKLTGEDIAAWHVAKVMTDKELRHHPGVGDQAFRQIRLVYGPYDAFVASGRVAENLRREYPYSLNGIYKLTPTESIFHYDMPKPNL